MPVDVREACGADLLHRAADIVRLVPASDGGKHAILHRLGIDAHARGAVRAQDGELFGITFEGLDVSQRLFLPEDMLETQGKGQIMVTPLKELVEKNVKKEEA